jgi:hypothetical protein
VSLVKPRPPAKSPLARARASAQYPHPTGAQPERQRQSLRRESRAGAEISAQNRPQVLVHSPVHLIYSSEYCSRSPRIKSLVVLSELPNTHTLSLSLCLSAVLPLKLCSIWSRVVPLLQQIPISSYDLEQKYSLIILASSLVDIVDRPAC